MSELKNNNGRHPSSNGAASAISLDIIETGIERPRLDVENAVRDRYSDAAQEAEAALCCPVDYDPQYLEVLPQELIDRDYGCGNPAKYLHRGETVLDLGSGGGKICYIASQVVGPKGRVIGVDCNDEMLQLARGFQDEISERIGHNNVEFHKGRIQDLALDLDVLEQYLADHPADSSSSWLAAQSQAQQLRTAQPMIANDSVDVIVSNCVLNLVRREDREALFREMHRVLKRGGRAVISDITSDEVVSEELKQDPRLWSGCISGAFVEHEFLQAFEEAGFYGIQIVARQEEPWVVVEGIEFRSVTVEAFKGKEGPCDDYKQAVVYRGPWKQVVDDDGHVLKRGIRTAVCQKTFEIYSRAPYADDFFTIEPSEPVRDVDAVPFNCKAGTIRSPKETKGENFKETRLADDGSCCEPGGCC